MRAHAKQEGTYCSHKPECIVATNPDRSVLITIMTRQFQSCPMNVSILHLKYQYLARSESRFACYSHCYVTWCPLTTGVVASQFPSSRDAVLVTCYLTPFISPCLNFKTISTALKVIYKESANIIEGFCHQWLLEFLMKGASAMESIVTRAGPSCTHNYLTPGICSLIKPAAMVKLM